MGYPTGRHRGFSMSCLINSVVCIVMNFSCNPLYFLYLVYLRINVTFPMHNVIPSYHGLSNS